MPFCTYPKKTNLTIPQKEIYESMESDSSFINGDLFIEYQHHFQDHVILLIIDNHSCHISLAINFYRKFF